MLVCWLDYLRVAYGQAHQGWEREDGMTKKRKGLARKARPTKEELLKKLSKLNRILSHSEEDYKVGDHIIEVHKITGELYKRHLRVK